MYKQLKTISIDWFQMNCKFSHAEYSDFQGSKWNQEVYEVKRRDEGTKIFEVVEYIFQKVGTRTGQLIATACSVPRSSVIPKDTVLIKFENNILYDVFFDFTVQEFIKYNKLIFIGISRLDIACDFNFFAKTHRQGKPRDPHKFIRDFAERRIVKMGRGKGRLYFEVGRRLTWDTLRFSGKDSPISVYLYNKTKEMLQVKMKPHIVEQWDAIGLDKTKNVWRLEISIKGARKVLENISTKEKIDFYTLNILKEENIKLLWDSLINKYFGFARENGDKNKSRMPKIELFTGMQTHGVVIERTDKKESNNMDTFFCNKLYKVFDELRGTENDLRAANCLDLRKWFVGSRDQDRKRKLATDKLLIGNPVFKDYTFDSEINKPTDEAPPPELIEDEFNFNN